jgi:hypothetical protein
MFDAIRRDAALFEHGADDTFAFRGEGEKKVQGMDGLVAIFGGKLLGLLNSFLCFLGKFIESERHFVKFPSDRM